MYQCSAGLQKTVSYWSISPSIHMGVVWQLWKQGILCKKKSSDRPRVSDEDVRQAEATLVEGEGNLCGREAVSYRCRKRLCGKFYAGGFAWNRTITVGLGDLKLQMENGWSGLLSLPISLHVTSVELCKGTSVCVTSTSGYWWIEVENCRSYRDNWQKNVRKSMGWAGLQTTHLWSHGWSTRWASLGYVKPSEFVIQTCNSYWKVIEISHT
jgi:hypothetical protein